MSTKKRTLLPTLNEAMVKMASMSSMFAELEYKDNDQMSRRLKREFRDFKRTEIAAIDDMINEVRNEIINRPKSNDKRRNAFKNLNKKQTEDNI